MRTFIAILISIVTLISCDNFEPSPLVGRYTYGNFIADITQQNENTLRLTVEYHNDIFNYTNSGTFDAKPIHGTYQGFFAYVYTDSCGTQVQMGKISFGGDYIEYTDYKMVEGQSISFEAQRVE